MKISKSQIFNTGAFLTPFVFMLVFLATPVSAGLLTDSHGNLDCGRIAGIFQTIIDMVATLAGIAFFIMMIAGGVMYMISTGNPEGAQRAQQTLIWGVIGTLIAVGMVFLTSTVAEDILGADTSDIFNLTKWICTGF